MNKDFVMNITQERIVSILHQADDFVTAREFRRRIGITPRQLRIEVAS